MKNKFRHHTKDKMINYSEQEESEIRRIALFNDCTWNQARLIYLKQQKQKTLENYK